MGMLGHKRPMCPYLHEEVKVDKVEEAEQVVREAYKLRKQWDSEASYMFSASHKLLNEPEKLTYEQQLDTLRTVSESLSFMLAMVQSRTIEQRE